MESRALLRKIGYKATPARIAILSLLSRARNPINVKDIIEKLNGRFDNATVYRFIYQLKSKGIIRQIDLRENLAHFEMTDRGDHHHIVCTRCGRIEEIDGCEIEDMYKLIARKTQGFKLIEQHSLEFYGICKNCISRK